MNDIMILLVEDNADVQDFNKFLLMKEGYAVETAMTLADAREIVAGRMPDAIVLDIGMPDGSGLDFLRELRQTSKVPVLMLTGYKKDKDVVQGFKSGCDDYLPKPYTFEVLLVRLQRLLQSAEKVPETITHGALTLKTASMTAFLNGVDLLLTQKEFALLLLFTQNENKVIGKDYLFEQVWGQQANNVAGALKSHISNLRLKLKDSGLVISAERGGGYRLYKEKII